MRCSRLFVIALIVAIAALASSTFISLAADCTKVVVTEDDIKRQPENSPPTDNWVLYTRNAGNGAFRSGPGTPPSGTGSFQFVTPTGADKATLFNFDHAGTALADIDQMSYSTYRTAGSAQQVTAINVVVDLDGNGSPDTTLVYEPVYNGGGVVDGVWQTWDAYNGGNAIWWSSNPIPSAPNRDTFVSWDTIVGANPGAVILAYGLNQGSGNPALTVATDNLTIGYNEECTTYNFEQYRVATTQADCKNGGYNRVKDAQGRPFKNQGQCIQYVNTGK